MADIKLQTFKLAMGVYYIAWLFVIINFQNISIMCFLQLTKLSMDNQ